MVIEVYPPGFKMKRGFRIDMITRPFAVFGTDGDIVMNCSLTKVKFDKPTINADFDSDSKTNVEKHFKKVFGYGSFVNPETYKGTFIRKSEINGNHDGLFMTKPVKREEGYIYQKFINSYKDGKYHDIRCFIFGFEIKYIWYKGKTTIFKTDPTLPVLEAVEKEFTKEETEKINQFCKSIGLEYGELDVLRDKDGKVYILDCNNTPGGYYIHKMKKHQDFFSKLSVEMKEMCENKVERRKEAPPEYYDKIFEQKEYNIHYTKSNRMKIWRNAIQYLKKDEWICEVGSGAGQFAQMLEDNGYNNYIGIDFCKQAFEKAKKRSGQSFICDDCFKFDYSGFQTVVGIGFIEHVNDFRFLRLLKKGTKVLFTCPDFPDPSHLRVYKSEQQIRNRYKSVIDIKSIKPIKRGDKVSYLLFGIIL